MSGPLMVGIQGTSLTDEERETLCDARIGAVILFSRNYSSCAQLRQLTDELTALPRAPLIIATDHEGGRVQRFRDGFTGLPALRAIGKHWREDEGRARAMARAVGFITSTELVAHGIDLSFAPVADLDFGASAVIGDRSFGRDPVMVCELASELNAGLIAGGMAGGVLKHFPGHGYAAADSHFALPVDERELHELLLNDLVPYQRARGTAGVMVAHVRYPKVDQRLAGFSRIWLDQILRKECHFEGVIFSDDLEMAAACDAGNPIDRVLACLDAGCDMALICNDATMVREVLDGISILANPARATRIGSLRKSCNAESDSQREEDLLAARLLLSELTDAQTSSRT